MRLINFKICIFLILIEFHIPLFSAEINLCAPDEIMIASCHLSEKKRRAVSFCASADKSIINYRFGLRPDITMASSFSNAVPLYRWEDAATYTVYLGFREGNYSYVFGVPQETLGARAFLSVAKNNKSSMSLLCINNSFGEKRFKSEAIIDVADNIVRNADFIFPPEGGR